MSLLAFPAASSSYIRPRFLQYYLQLAHINIPHRDACAADQRHGTTHSFTPRDAVRLYAIARMRLAVAGYTASRYQQFLDLDRPKAAIGDVVRLLKLVMIIHLPKCVLFAYKCEKLAFSNIIIAV